MGVAYLGLAKAQGWRDLMLWRHNWNALERGIVEAFALPFVSCLSLMK